MLRTIQAIEARRLLERGAVLIDIREADEHARTKIPGARHVPLSKLDEANLANGAGKPILFHCKSGARTRANASRLASRIEEGCEAYIVEGGIDAWRRAGLPVVIDRRQPLELQRQVQIGAGSLVVSAVLLGLFVSPWFFAIAAFVGIGLIAAGITGFCGMALLLMRAPWNKRPYPMKSPDNAPLTEATNGLQ
jgi:rhodanese-related sulfurtransferase